METNATNAPRYLVKFIDATHAAVCTTDGAWEAIIGVKPLDAPELTQLNACIAQLVADRDRWRLPFHYRAAQIIPDNETLPIEMTARELAQKAPTLLGTGISRRRENHSGVPR